MAAHNLPPFLGLDAAFRTDVFRNRSKLSERMSDYQQHESRRSGINEAEYVANRFFGDTCIVHHSIREEISRVVCRLVVVYAPLTADQAIKAADPA